MSDTRNEVLSADETHDALRTCCLLTQISLVRNVSDLPFPSHLRGRKSREAAKMLCDRLTALVPAEDVTDDEDLAASGHVRFGIAPKADRSPDYHLFQISLKHGTVIWCELMSANHFTFSVSGPFLNFEFKARILTQFVDMLAGPMHFAYDPSIGYLTTQLTLTGNGLRIRSWMHLPGLSHFGHLRELCNAAEMCGVLAELEQPDNPPPGHVIILFNRSCMTAPIGQLVNEYKNFLEETAYQEMISRKRLLRDEPFVFVDLLTRTKSLLGHATMINASEAMDALSDLRLGVTTGVISTKHAKAALDPDWFVPVHDDVFFREIGQPLLQSGEKLPPEVRQFAPWRDDALRARCLRTFADFSISKSLKERARRQ